MQTTHRVHRLIGKGVVKDAPSAVEGVHRGAICASRIGQERAVADISDGCHLHVCKAHVSVLPAQVCRAAARWCAVAAMRCSKKLLPAGHLKQATAAQRAIVVAEEDVGYVAIGAAAEQAPALHTCKQPGSGMSAILGALRHLILCNKQQSAFKAGKG